MVRGRRPDDEPMPKAAMNTLLMLAMYENGLLRVKKAEEGKI